MRRHLDLTALRSFCTVAEAGGVTRAAGMLNLTQSAVSMQIKRLEEALDLELLDRTGRGVSLTAAGEQLRGYGERLLALNDEAWRKLTAEDYEGELRLGVPHDIIYPRVPPVLKAFAAELPRMRVHLVSAPSLRLKQMFARGEVDVILTTEDAPAQGPQGEGLIELPLVWLGAAGGTSWRSDPLRVAFCRNCIFRAGVIRRLDAAGRAWEMVVDSELDNAVDAAVSADLAVTAAVEGNRPPLTEPVPAAAGLPDLGATWINLYVQGDDPARAALARLLREAHGAPARAAA